MKIIIKRTTYFKAFITSLMITAVMNLQAQDKKDTSAAPKEDDYFQIKTLPIPEDVILEVGGMAFMPDDKLAVSTRHGEVWIISNPYMKNGQAPQYKLFAQGLHEALGLNYIKGDLYLTQRSELTRLRDLDHDGVADEYKTVCSWPLSGNYHEYAYGPVLDKDGKMTVNLNLAWIGYGESLSRWHGWSIKISDDGQIEPFVTGLRSPAGLGINSDGELFYAENQGDWVGSGSITHMEKGDFMGNPGGLNWSDLPGSPVTLHKKDIPDTNEPKYEVAKRVPGLKTPSVWFPHTILGISTSGILNYSSAGKMGPFKDQLFVGDQGQSKIMRVYLEKIKGVYQGVVFPFREGFSSGILRMNWGSDGSMFVGMTSRGWSSTGGGLYGVQQLVWNGKTPFEMQKVNAKPDGFEVEFTQSIDEKTARDPYSWQVSTFTYQYHHNYGSPVINQGSCPIKAIEVSADKLKVRLVLDSLKLGYIHEIKADGIRSADKKPLLHNNGYYTLNRIPDGDKLTITDANKVKPVMRHDMKGMNMKTVAPAKSVKRLTKQPADWTKGPDKTIVLGTIPGLKFDLKTITVKAGSKVKLTFKNNDDMLHNLVVTKPNTCDKVGSLAIKMGLKGQSLSFIPATPDVLFYTKLLQPKEKESIYFIAPTKPGQYQYVCTYPGHYQTMRGVLTVTQ